MKFSDIINQSKRAEDKMGELVDALRVLRKGSDDWERGVQGDPRHSVQLLYGELVTARSEHRAFLENEVQTPPRLGP